MHANHFRAIVRLPSRVSNALFSGYSNVSFLTAEYATLNTRTLMNLVNVYFSALNDTFFQIEIHISSYQITWTTKGSTDLWSGYLQSSIFNLHAIISTGECSRLFIKFQFKLMHFATNIRRDYYQLQDVVTIHIAIHDSDSDSVRWFNDNS